jgi:hypothetical protein
MIHSPVQRTLVKADELLQELVQAAPPPSKEGVTTTTECDVEFEEEDKGCYEDADFWEALELLKDARHFIELTLTHPEASRRRLDKMQKLADEIGIFRGFFFDDEEAKSE